MATVLTSVPTDPINPVDLPIEREPLQEEPEGPAPEPVELQDAELETTTLPSLVELLAEPEVPLYERRCPCGSAQIDEAVPSGLIKCEGCGKTLPFFEIWSLRTRTPVARVWSCYHPQHKRRPLDREHYRCFACNTTIARHSTNRERSDVEWL